MAESRPARTLGGEHDSFWSWCDQEELRLQRCDACNELQWPPVAACTSCESGDLTWTKMSGRARVRSSCVFEREYFPECPTPWPVIVVELDEGPLFVTNPHEVDVDELENGSRVELAFLECEDAHGRFRLPVFGAASHA